MNEQWQELKETIIEMRDNNGTGTQQEVCKFLVNLMDVLEKQMQEPCEDAVSRDSALKALCYACSVHQNGGKCSKCNSYNAISDLSSVAPSKPTCDDAVSREAVLNTLDTMDKALDEDRTVEAYKELLKESYKELLPVTPKQRSGKWVEVDTNIYSCSKCNHCFTIVPEDNNISQFIFCPNCRAKMEGEDE